MCFGGYLSRHPCRCFLGAVTSGIYLNQPLNAFVRWAHISLPAPPRLRGYPSQDAWCWVWLVLGGVCGGGGLFWLHVLGFVFYYCFSGAADFIISSVLRTCVGIHLMLWCALCFFISLLVICTHQFDRLGFIFGLFPFSFTWQGYIYHDTD